MSQITHTDLKYPEREGGGGGKVNEDTEREEREGV